MQKLISKIKSQRSVAAGGDQVLLGLSLPAGSVLHGFNGSIEYHRATGVLEPLLSVAGIGMEGWILPVSDPDAAEAFDATWDRLVPKDTDVETIDEDTGAADSTPFWEIGEPDWTTIFDVGLQPRKVWGKYQMLTAGTTHGPIVQDNQTPFTFEWLPLRREVVRQRRNYRVSVPSVLLFAMSVSSGDDTTVTLPTALAENGWNRLMYIKDVLHEALRSLYGLTESGAETPYEEAVALLKAVLEPDFVEETAATFAAYNLEAISEMAITFSVVGELNPQVLSSGRG